MRDESRCAVCGDVLAAGGRGRPATYCSRGCQAKAYRRRRRPPVPRAELVASRTAQRRRQEIVEAVWRIAATRGLDAASMREIATEAGVSLRVVQYHFANKHDVLVTALTMLNAHNEQRTQARIARLGEPMPPRELLRVILEEFLPTDDERRDILRVYTAYYARGLADPALAGVFLNEEQPVDELVAAILAQGAVDTRDPRAEAELLVSGIAGFGLDVLHGRRTLDEARRTIDYHLTRLFTA